MLIKCPKCRSVYDLPDDLISDEGLKMRCSACSEIWIGYPEDALKKVNTTPKNIQKMFKQISKETDDLFAEEIKQATVNEDVGLTKKDASKKNNTINIVLMVCVAIILLLLLYVFRYDIVRLLPQTENLYSKINVSSVQYGTDLEIKNITTREYIENNISRIEIRGMVVNQGKYVIKLPPVKIDIFDNKGNLLLSIEKELSLPRLEAGYNILFNVDITNPTPYVKTVHVTLKDN